MLHLTLGQLHIGLQGSLAVLALVSAHLPGSTDQLIGRVGGGAAGWSVGVLGLG